VSAPPEVAVNGQARCACCLQPAGVGSRLCNDGRRTVRAALDPDNEGNRDTQAPASIPVYYARLTSAPGRSGDFGRRAPGFRSTPPCDLNVVAMRDRRSSPDPVVDVWYPQLAGTDRPDYDRPCYEQSGEVRPVVTALANTARSLWEHLGYHGPLRPGGYVVAGGVEGLASWLHDHVDDLTAHDRAGEIHGFLTDLVEQLRVGARDPRDKPAGSCIELVRVQGRPDPVECRADLFLPPPRPGVVELSADQVAMTCGRCHRGYRVRDLVRLRLANQQAEAS